MKIKVEDIVVVIAGKDKGKQGKVTRVLSKSNQVVVEGVNKVVRHVKKTRERAGERIEKEAPIDVSNVMYFDADKKQASRLGYQYDEKQGKVRIFKKAASVVKDVFKRS